MKRSLIRWIYILILLFIYVQAYTQSNPDDYWLNNGFTSGQTVYTNSGFFYDDGGFDLYQAGQNWNVRFCSENGNPITVDFSGFRTDYRGPWPPLANSYLSYDYMSITTSIPPQLVAYNDDTPQFSFTSPDGCIRFGFVSQLTSLRDSGWIAEISADPPPPNNDPCDAIEIPVGNSCSPGFYTNKGAYNTTTLGSPSCHSYYGGDVWFTATVPTSGELKIETIAGSLNYAIMALYTGTCSSLLALDCVDNLNDMPAVILSGRTPGEVIYIRIFGDQAKSGTFGICATDPAIEVSGIYGPGGVGDSLSILFWYRTDTGLLDGSDNPLIDGSTVKTWKDQSGNNNDLIQAVSGLRPVLDTLALNGKPALVFDGTDDRFTQEFGSVTAPVSLFAAAQFTSAFDESILAIGDANEDNTFSLSREDDARYYSYSFSTENYGPSLDASANIINPAHSSGSPYHKLSINAGTEIVSDYGSAITTDGSMYLGSSKDSDRYFSGNLSEIFLYNKNLNSAQEVIINNYLAAKYLIDIGLADLYDYELTHGNDVAGIGRIDVDNTHTKAQSAGLLSMGGASDLENSEFVFFGHDLGDVSNWTSSEVPSGDTCLMRLAREWRVGISGGDGPGTLDIGLELNNLPAMPAEFDFYNIMVDADGDFTSGAVTYGLSSTGDELVANNVTLSDGDYIAIECVRSVVGFTSSSSSGLESVAHPLIGVSFNFPVSEQVNIGYRISGGTATGGGVDYSLNDAELIFNPGDISLDIVPLILDDSIVEIPDEYFAIELYNAPANIEFNLSTNFTYTIHDDDILISITATDTVTGACPASTTELTASVSGQGPFTYSWSPSAELSHPDSSWTTADPASNTRYYFTVTDALSNSYTDSIDIEVIPLPVKPAITALGDLAFCTGDSLRLRADSATAYLWLTGETTREIIVKTAGDYTVEVFDQFGCAGPLSDPVTVTVYSLPSTPVISAGGPAVFCEGGSVELTSTAASSYLWNTGAISQSIIVDTTGNYTVRVTDANSCQSPESDPLFIQVNPLPAKPVIDITGDTEFCEGGSVILGTASMDGYLWSTGETTQSVNVNTSGKYAVVVTDANTCTSPPSDSVEIIVNVLPAKPAVTINGDPEFCEGGSVELSTGAASLYSWSTGEITQSIIVSTSGKYAVSVTDANGCDSPVSDSVTITVNPLPVKPVVTANGPAEFCEGGSVELTTAAMDSYQWSTMETTQSITVDASGDYTVTVTDSNSCQSEESDPFTVTVNPLPAKPAITVTGDTRFCEGGSVDLTTDIMDGYLWNTGETTQSISVSSVGKYTVVVTDVNSCESPASDSVEIIVDPLPGKPVITANGATEFCDGGSVELVSENADSYAWSTGETTQNIIVSTSGKYVVTVTDANNCVSPVSDTLEVVVHSLPAKPDISYSGDTELCEGEEIELSTAVMSSYLWSTGQTTQSITVNTSGSYNVIVTDDNSCQSPVSDDISVTVISNPLKPSVTINGDTEFCEGESVELISESGDSYLWSNGATTASITVAEAGEYSVQVSNASGCTSPASDPVTVSVNPLPGKPVITASGPLDFITGDSVILTSTSAENYFWSNSATTMSVIVKESGTYTVFVTDINSCESQVSDPVSVTVSDYYPAPEITYTGNTEFCSGESLELICEAASSYAWSTGDTTRSIVVDAAGSYSVRTFDSAGRESLESDPVIITVLELPEFSVSLTDVSCYGSDDGMAVAVTGPGVFTYNWSTGSIESQVTSLAAGTYSLGITDSNGCSDSEEFTIVQPEQILISGTIRQPYCPDAADGEISVEVTGGTQPYTYEWSSGDAGDGSYDLTPGSYTLEVTDTKFCSATKVFELGYDSEICFEIPTIITPNDDGKNDEWIIEGLELYPQVIVEVFDRWGRRVFYSKGYDINWDGRYNGKDLPVDSYHFVINLNNGTPAIKGNITILR